MDTGTLPLLRRCLRAVAVHPPGRAGDADLLGRFARDRDAAAFEALIGRHGPMVLGVCRRILRRGPDADDAFQATFLLLVQRAGSLRQPEQLGPWLYGVACRTALKARSRAARQPLPLPADGPEAPAAAGPSAELAAVLDAAVRGLPAKYREPVVLCYLQGLTNAQAAEQIGCPPGTVATRLARARARLRARLSRYAFQAPAALLAGAFAAPAGAALPAGLVGGTVRLTRGAAVPPAVAGLIHGLSGRFCMTKWHWLATVTLAALGLAGAGAGLWTFRAGAQEAPPMMPLEKPAGPIADTPRPSHSAPVGQTPNFRVEAPTPRLAAYIALAAERHRKEAALAWLGRELPNWEKPCLVQVRLSDGNTAGATTFQFGDRRVSTDFQFGDGRVTRLQMNLEGSLERILTSALPHEVTHTVLADRFGRALPRWADEGAAILAEDAEEQARHDRVVRHMLKSGRVIPLRKLLDKMDYPEDVMVLYAQGYSLTRFLVERKDRGTFLAFVGAGLKGDWERAVLQTYGLPGIDGLEQAWLDHLGKTPRKAPASAPPVVPPADVTAEPSPYTVGKPLAEGAAPVTALAQVDEAGCVIVKIPVVGYEPTTVYEPREGPGGEMRYEPKTVYRPRNSSQVIVYAPGSLKAYDVEGKPVAPAALRERLKTGVPALVAQDGKMIDRFYLQLVKADTLILVPPTPAVPELLSIPSPPAIPSQALPSSSREAIPPPRDQ